jgi:AcrR family transcriptional regulator
LPRVIKHPSVRKAELLAAARALFFERGYDVTSVDEIIARAGVSKGTFYYYFPSKEATLEALAEQMANDAVAQDGDILKDGALNSVDRLNALLGRARQAKVANAPQILSSFEALFRSENIALYHRAHMAVSQVMAPIVATIIAQGMEEGVFRSNDPAATAEILLGLMTTTHGVVGRLFAARTEEEFKQAAAAFERRFVEQGIAIDRILGLPDGSVRLIEPGFAEALFVDWRALHAATA